MIKGIFPKYTWNMPEDQKILYLTFDDGPTPEITNWTLDLLKSYDAKATFFCIGTNVKQHPEIFQNLLESGHAIGNHTYNHPYGWRTKTDEYVAEVLKTQQAMSAAYGVSKTHTNNPPVPKRHVRAGQQPAEEARSGGSPINNQQSSIFNPHPARTENAHSGESTTFNPPLPKRHVHAGQQPARTEKARSGGSPINNQQSTIFNPQPAEEARSGGSTTHLFRPPYGQIKPSQGKQLLALGYQIIMWDILSFDWKASLSKEACARNVVSKAGPGSIIVFHDSVKAAPRMKHALKATLAHFSAQGYQFKSIEF
ncbi:polysaccharide deacetylase family protein [Gelidibacter sp. F2691]|nr:polysaccharide deacetylase family protein [Gelidibacter sp. F2691]